MTALLKEVGDKVGKACVVRRGLQKDGCRILMTEVPAPRLVIDFDRPGSPLAQDAPRCDYLLVAEDEHAGDWVVVLELKKGRFQSGQVVRQLQAGASAAEKLVSRRASLRFRPVVASSGARKHERAELRKPANAVRFQGHNEPVRMMRCGGCLVDVLA